MYNNMMEKLKWYYDGDWLELVATELLAGVAISKIYVTFINVLSSIIVDHFKFLQASQM